MSTKEGEPYRGRQWLFIFGGAFVGCLFGLPFGAQHDFGFYGAVAGFVGLMIYSTLEAIWIAGRRRAKHRQG